MLKSTLKVSTLKETSLVLFRFSEAWKKRYSFLVGYLSEDFLQLSSFLRLKEPVRPCLRTTYQLERIRKEIKRRYKVIEVFSSEDSLVFFVYLILRTENEKLSQRRLRGFRNLEWEEG